MVKVTGGRFACVRVVDLNKGRNMATPKTVPCAALTLLLLAVLIPNYEGNQCVPIDPNSPLCYKFYNKTTFPNFVQHRSPGEASYELVQYKPLIQVECSKYLEFFLCTIYMPICNDEYGKIPPCRALCEAARDGCKTLMEQFGFTWPQNLKCERYPKSVNNAICVEKKSVDHGGTRPTSKPGGGRGYPTTGTGQTNGCFDKPDITREPDISDISRFNYKCPKDQNATKHYHFMGLDGCASECKPIYFLNSELNFSRTWIMFWSIVCIVSTAFTLLTFLVDMSRFRYPERPIIFLSGCFFIIAIVFLLGTIADKSIACHEKSIDGGKKKWLLNQGTDHAACTVAFMFIYFFLMSASIWWVILTLTWFLAAGLKWGHEAIEASSQYFHAAAWAIPAALTIAILAMNKIEGDLLSGVCFVGGADVQGWFVLAPLFVYLVIGVFFLFAGFIALVRIRSVLKTDRGVRTDKLTKLMVRIGIFSVLYMLPAIIVIACLFYEHSYRPIWDKAWKLSFLFMSFHCNGCTCYDPIGRTRPDFAVFMIKYLMLLMVGITSGFWIWSGKTIQSWRNFYHGKILRRRIPTRRHGSHDGSAHTALTGQTRTAGFIG